MSQGFRNGIPRWAAASVCAAALLAAATAAAGRVGTVELQFVPRQPVEASPPLPPPSELPVQLVLDDDSADGDSGFNGAEAFQFLWLNRFSPGAAGGFLLREVWVLFSPGPNMALGAEVELAVYSDDDGDPASGATLLATYSATIQELDGETFSIYPIDPPLEVPAGDVLIGVVDRFVESGVTSPIFPAAVDTTATAGRSWLVAWSGDPPSGPGEPALPSDNLMTTVNGNWMIRGFGTPRPTIDVPTLNGVGLVLLAGLLGLAGILRARSGGVIAAVILALVWAPPAAAATVDDLSTAQGPVAAPSSTSVGGAGILGANRDMVVSLTGGAGTVSAGIAGGQLSFTADPTATGEVELTWDGDTDPGTLDPTGLGNQDLTEGGTHAALSFNIAAAGAGAELEVEVFTDGANASIFRRPLPALAAATVFNLPFADFIPSVGLAGADFADTGAVVLRLRGTDVSVDLGGPLQTAAAAPVIGAAKVDLDLMDGDLGSTTVSPGDTVRYRVTITNTGGEAAAVSLEDLLEAAGAPHGTAGNQNITHTSGMVRSTPLAFQDEYTHCGNTTLSVDGAVGFEGLLDNDSDPDGDTLTVVSVQSPSEKGGTVVLDDPATGEFTYEPPAGFAGVDTFTYVMQDDDANQVTGTAVVTIDDLVWFVDNNPPAASLGLGTLAHPFADFTQLDGAGGAGDVDEAAHLIFVHGNDAGDYDGGLELEAGQRLFGEGVQLTECVRVPIGPATRPRLIHTAGDAITLGQNNTIRGLNVGNTSGRGIFGSGFGTLTTSSVTVLGSGTALELDSGSLAGSFDSLASASGAVGIDLDGVSGSLAVVGTTVIDGTAVGIRVANGGSTYDFGTTSIGQTSSVGTGVVLSASATSSFTFDSLAVTTSAGGGLVAASAGTINIGTTGNTIDATGGPVLDIAATNFGAGGVTFASLSASDTGENIPGLRLVGVGGGNLASTSTTLTNIANPDFAADGVDIRGTTADVNLGGGSLSGVSGTAFNVGSGTNLDGGANAISYAGSITNTSGRSVAIQERSGGTVTLSGNIDGTGSGILLRRNNNGSANTVTLSGSSKVLDTAAQTAVRLDDNDDATINITGGGLDIDTTSGLGLHATGGGTLTVSGAGNTADTGTGTAVHVADTTIAAAGVTFQRLSADGAASGIVLDTTGALGGLTVTGVDGPCGKTMAALDCDGGTLQNTTGDAVVLNDTDAVSLSFMRLTTIGNMGAAVTGHDGIDATDVSGLTFNSVSADAISDSLVNATRLSGLTVQDCDFQNSNRYHLAGVADQGAEAMLKLDDLGGTNVVDNSDLQNGASILEIDNTTVDLGLLRIQRSTIGPTWKDLSGNGVGRIGIDVLLRNDTDATVHIGDPGETDAGLGNDFLDGAVASLRMVHFDAGASGLIDAIVSRNNFTVTTLDNYTEFGEDQPQGGVVLRAFGNPAARLVGVISHNVFTQVGNADGRAHPISLFLDADNSGVKGGVMEARVNGNTINLPINGGIEVAFDNATGGTVLLDNNVIIGGMLFFPDVYGVGATFPVPAFSPVNILDQGGGAVDVILQNMTVPAHDAFFPPVQDVLVNASCPSGGCAPGAVSAVRVGIADVDSAGGFRLAHSAGTLSLERGSSGSGVPATVMADNFNTGALATTGTVTVVDGPLDIPDTPSAATITATGGTPQSTTVGTPFATPLQVTVLDAGANPVPFAVVRFVAPSQAGASCVFPDGRVAIADAAGVATVAVAANGTAGAYVVSANVDPALGAPATFSLTNNP